MDLAGPTFRSPTGSGAYTAAYVDRPSELSDCELADISFFFFSLSLSSCMTITGFRRIPLLFLIPYHRIQVTMRCRKHTGSGSSMRRGDVYCRLRSFLTLNSLPCSANHRFCCSRFSETRGVGAIPADDRSTVSLRLGTVGGLAAGRLAQTCQGLQAILHILRCCDFGYT